MNKKILVAYASLSGSTGEVAEAIGQVLAKAGVIVQVRHVKDVTGVRFYSAVVLGSSIRAGRWLPEAIQFLETYHETLSQIPVAYFTTCLTMVNDTEESRRTVLAYMEPLGQIAPQIKPVGLGLFAGSLDPNRPLIMQSKLTPQGDYRDWPAIRAWAEEIRPALLAGEPSEEPIVLRQAILRYTDMSGTDLSGIDLRGADLHEANLSKAHLQGAELSEIDLIKADLHKADLYQASLRQAGLNWANLSGAKLAGANLSQANLIGADLNRANLSQANLSQAILNGANLSQANLNGADLSYADLNWANLSGANLNQANLNQARYNNQTEWPEGFSAQTKGGIIFRIE